MAEEVEIEISPTGQVMIRTFGIKGARCIDAAEFLARIVGQEESRELTSEYYESGQALSQQQNLHQHRTP